MRTNNDLYPISKIIKLAQARGVNFGDSNPENRIRYYIKFGLLPHAKRKSFNNEPPSAAFKLEVVEQIVAIEKKRAKGKSIAEQKVLLQNQPKIKVKRAQNTEGEITLIPEQKSNFIPRVVIGLTVLVAILLLTSLFANQVQTNQKVLGTSTKNENGFVRVAKAIVSPLSYLNLGILKVIKTSDALDPLGLTNISDYIQKDGDKLTFTNKIDVDSITTKSINGYQINNKENSFVTLNNDGNLEIPGEIKAEIGWEYIKDKPDLAGSIDLIAGSNIILKKNTLTNAITISATASSSGSGTITAVVAGTGLSGGGSSGLVTLNIDTSVTQQGNVFNGANQLVQLNGSAQLPALSGINLTSIDATNITSGTLGNGGVTLALGIFGSITGILGDANIADTITASNYLPLSGGILSGSLTVAGVTGLADGDIPNTITIASTSSIDATAINSGTLGNGSVILALGLFSSITGSLGDANVADNITASNYLPLGGGTLIGSVTVAGVTGLLDADIPNTITVSNYLLLSGGTMAGNVDFNTNLALNIGNAGTDFTAGGGLNLAATLTLGGDANLYRSAADTLKTDDNFVVGGTTGLTFTGAGGDITFTNGEKVENDTNGFIKLIGNAAAGSGTLIYTAGQSVFQAIGNVNNSFATCPIVSFGGCVGIYSLPTVNINSPTGAAYGISGTVKVDDSTAGAITLQDGVAILAADLTKGAADVITNAYGVHIDNITAGGTKNIGLCFDCLDGTHSSTTVSGGIQWGNDATTTQNLRLYRSNGATAAQATIDDGAGTVLIQSNTTTTSINLSAQVGGTAQRLCHNGADAATGVQQIGDCGGTQADLAEYYGVNDDSDEGTLVVLDGEAYETHYYGGKTSIAHVVKSSTSYQNTLLGIVSTNPSGEILGETAKPYLNNPKPIALIGRVPVKVSTEKGPIKPGDYLTSSSIPGVAMKATSTGPTIGKALGSYSALGIGKILVFVDNSFYVNLREAPTQNLDSETSYLSAFISKSGEAIFSKVTAVFASFQKLVFGEIAVKKGSQSAGTGELVADQNEVLIQSDKVKEDSLINLTPDSEPDGVLYIKSKIAGKSFVVGIKRFPGNISSKKVEFNWLIVNQE